MKWYEWIFPIMIALSPWAAFACVMYKIDTDRWPWERHP